MNFSEIYLESTFWVLAYVFVIWALSVVKKDSSIIDIFWGFGFVCLVIYFYFHSQGYAPRKNLILVLACLWGLRLTLHLAKRNLGQPEDYRYQKWREEHGKNWWWRSFFTVFIFQGLIMWVVAAPLLGAQHPLSNSSWNFFDLLGIILWGIGILFETLGDWQLTQFRKNPENKNKVLQTGLWKYTRHPNYFGDACVWWGFFALACANQVYFVAASPIIMNFFLVKVSGVAMLERNLRSTKEGYQEYIERTNAFWPWFPRK